MSILSWGASTDDMQRRVACGGYWGRAHRLRTGKQIAVRLPKRRSGGSRFMQRKSSTRFSSIVGFHQLTISRRHRNRKAEYITTLEDEITRLRHLDSEVTCERDQLEKQNEAMKQLLASHSLDAQLGSIDLSTPSQPQISHARGGSVTLRYDEQMESERWFVDLMDSGDVQWAPSQASGLESREHPKTNSAPDTDDNCIALDFILGLEYPCRNHVHHPLINPDGFQLEPGNAHGHAMTTTAAVFAGALQVPSLEAHPSQKQDSWFLPHTEIDKLIDLSGKLAVDDAEITPAQAYSAVREAVPNDTFLKPVLEALRQPLGKLVHCAHFGSLLDTSLFWQRFDSTVQSLQFTRPDLCGAQCE